MVKGGPLLSSVYTRWWLPGWPRCIKGNEEARADSARRPPLEGSISGQRRVRLKKRLTKPFSTQKTGCGMCGAPWRGGHIPWTNTCRWPRWCDRPVLLRPSRRMKMPDSAASVTRDDGNMPWMPCGGCLSADCSRRYFTKLREQRAQGESDSSKRCGPKPGWPPGAMRRHVLLEGQQLASHIGAITMCMCHAHLPGAAAAPR